MILVYGHIGEGLRSWLTDIGVSSPLWVALFPMQVLLGFLEKLAKHNPEIDIKCHIPLCFLLQVLFEFPSLFPLMIDCGLQDEPNPFFSMFGQSVLSQERREQEWRIYHQLYD